LLTSAWRAHRVHRHGNFRGYFTLLRFQASGEELQLLTNSMTVNETYFLREEYQFQCLVDSILPEIVKHKDGSDRFASGAFHSSSAKNPIRSPCTCLKNGPRSTNGM